MVYIAIWKQEKMPIYFKRQAQIEVQNTTQIRALLSNKAFTKVLVKYSNYSNIFSMKNVAKLLENIRVNKYTIKLEESKQPIFRSIYSLKSVKLETLKTYIKTNLANSFI